MTYSETIEFLYQLRGRGIKFGLQNTLRLAEAAGNPHRRLRFIHVAGTNGKGSTCAMLESIYRAAGYRVGLFTSPHLVGFRERIQVNRHPISKDDVIRLAEHLRTVMTQLDVAATFFEAVTIMAMCYFVEQDCDLVIWETGMGGRLDATNIVTPLASVITNVQLDHQRFLGDTSAAIAREKAGIIKPRIPVITAAADPAALTVIEETARQQESPLRILGTTEAAAMRQFEVALAGEHQLFNAALALEVVRALAPQFPVAEPALRQGFKTTDWAGRLQKVERPGGQTLLIDCAHNPAGAETLAQALRTEFAGNRPALILGVFADKDYASICAILAPLASKIFLSPILSQRGANPELLAQACRKANASVPTIICHSLAEALSRSAKETFVVLTGSIHFVGEAMEALGLEPGAPEERALNDYLPTTTRAVTFDVGGTLIEPWPSVGHVYAQVAARHGMRVSPSDLDRQFATAWKNKKNFGYSLSDWTGVVNATFAGLTDQQPTKHFIADLYAHFATATPWRIYPDVVPYLQSLRKQGLKLGVISNWDDRLRPLLNALKLDSYFDTIVVSAEAGVHKPEPRIFALAADQLGVPPSSILHIGDSPREDIEGARTAGFQARLLHRESGEVL